MILHAKLDLLSKRSTREKLLSNFYALAKEQGKTEIIVPFHRNELSDYLCVDRSVMSRELSKMRQEGLLTFEKNRFCIFTPDIIG